MNDLNGLFDSKIYPSGKENVFLLLLRPFVAKFY